MAKKFVRGITDIKNIEHQDFDTNNVNDLLSDGKHNYIHRKKQDGSEEYHNLTNNIKTIQSDNTDLVSVTNYNNTTNSATIRPKHDVQKEQLLESTDETILITHGENGTDETTSVDVNPAKVLEHDNLISNSEYITIEHEDESATTVITTDLLNTEISTLKEKTTLIGGRNLWIQSKATGEFTEESLPANHVTGQKKCYRLTNNQKIEVNLEPNFSPRLYRTVTLSAWIKYENVVQGQNAWDKFNVFKHNLYRKNSLTGEESSVESLVLDELVGTSEWKYVSYTYDYGANTSYDELKTTLRFVLEDVDSGIAWVSGIKVELGLIPTDYTQADEDVEYLIEQKQNTLTSNTSIGVDGTGLQQLYTQSQTYTHANATLKTHVKSVANSSSVTTLEEEFNFLAKMNKSQTNAEFTLNTHDTAVFEYLIDTYGVDNKINVCGSAFTLDGSQLSFATNGAQYNPHIINFNDIIPTSAINTNE